MKVALALVGAAAMALGATSIGLAGTTHQTDLVFEEYIETGPDRAIYIGTVESPARKCRGGRTVIHDFKASGDSGWTLIDKDVSSKGGVWAVRTRNDLPDGVYRLRTPRSKVGKGVSCAGDKVLLV